MENFHKNPLAGAEREGNKSEFVDAVEEKEAIQCKVFVKENDCCGGYDIMFEGSSPAGEEYCATLTSGFCSVPNPEPDSVDWEPLGESLKTDPNVALYKDDIRKDLEVMRKGCWLPTVYKKNPNGEWEKVLGENNFYEGFNTFVSKLILDMST